MNAAQKVLFDLLDVTIDGACEAAREEHFAEASVHFQECARLCEQMQLAKKAFRKPKEDKQLTIYIPA